MPCRSGYEDDDRQMISYEKLNTFRMIEAVLCGICTALEHPGRAGTRTSLPFVLDRIDWKEVGVTRAQFAVWWDNHKREDWERRTREDKERLRVALLEKAKQSALDKLTVEEQVALGLIPESRVATIKKRKKP